MSRDLCVSHIVVSFSKIFNLESNLVHKVTFKRKMHIVPNTYVYVWIWCMKHICATSVEMYSDIANFHVTMGQSEFCIFAFTLRGYNLGVYYELKPLYLWPMSQHAQFICLLALHFKFSCDVYV